MPDAATALVIGGALAVAGVFAGLLPPVISRRQKPPAEPDAPDTERN